MAPARTHLRLVHVRPCKELSTAQLHAIIGRALGAASNERARGREWVRADPKRAARLLGKLQRERVIDLAEDTDKYWLCPDEEHLTRVLRVEIRNG